MAAVRGRSPQSGPDYPPPPFVDDAGEELRRDLLTMVDRLSVLIDQIKQEGAAIYSNKIAAEMHQAAKAILLQRFRIWLISAAMLGVMLLAMGALADRLLFRPDIRGMTCADQDGGRVCAMWVIPPKQGGRT